MTESADSVLLLEVLKEIWKELREQREVLLQAIESVGKLDRLAETRFQALERAVAGIEERVSDAKDDLESAIRSELASVLGGLEAKLARLIEQDGGLRD